MRVVDDPVGLISRLKRGRLVFFGPSWGVVVVDVVEGEPVRVQSSWGGGPREELERLRSWGKVRFLLKPLPAGSPEPEPAEDLYPGSVEDLPSRLPLPEDYPKALRGAFLSLDKKYSEREWINAIAVAAELGGVRLVWVRGAGQEGWLLVKDGKVVTAAWGGSLNAEAVRKLAEDNRLFPLEVEVRSPALPGPAALSFGLPGVSEPTLEGVGSAVAKGLELPRERGFALLAGGEGFALYRGRVYSASGEEIGEKELLERVRASARAWLWAPTS